MIVAEQKPIREILDTLPAAKNLLLVGCNTCVTICMAGGEIEVQVLSATVRMAKPEIDTVTGLSIERQCDKEFFQEIIEEADKADVILSLACGVGVQMMSDYFHGKIVLPALNTMFMGSNENTGYWLERCIGCGECVLAETAGICPKTRCSKGLMNGPCGGSQDGMCEVDPDSIDCGWNLIYNRMKELNQLDRLMEIKPMRDWSRSHDGRPRRIIRDEGV